MSEQQIDQVELAQPGDSAFAELMDIMVNAAQPGEGQAPAGETGAPAPVAGAGAPADAVPGEAAGAVAPPATGGAAGDPAGGGGAGEGAPAAAEPGDAAGGVQPGGDAAGDGGADTGAGAGDAVPAAELIPKFGELAVALEERTTKAYQQEAYEAVLTEFPKYFEALNQHPRNLVGLEVPRPVGEGMERLESSEDARDWQDAMKQVLASEIQSRASKRMDENAGFLATLHASIGIFQNNPDLIPGTKDFDRELADQFAEWATPYELRVDGKLQGYSIDVQPIIARLRAALVAERAKVPNPPAEAPAGTAAAAATASTPGPAAAAPEPPQAGIPSKAGQGADDADTFGTLFGTINPALRDMRI